jgi:signal peptidase
MSKVKKQRRPISIIVTLLLILSTLLCFVIIFQSVTKKDASFFGYRFFYVTTGSMEPTIPPGSIILVHSSDEALKVGDIISFTSRDKAIYGKVNTHRIVGLSNKDGQLSFITKGDANNTADPVQVACSDVIGRVVWTSGYIPLLGWILEFIGTRLGFVFVILLPILFITAASIREFSKELLIFAHIDDHKR